MTNVAFSMATANTRTLNAPTGDSDALSRFFGQKVDVGRQSSTRSLARKSSFGGLLARNSNGSKFRVKKDNVVHTSPSSGPDGDQKTREKLLNDPVARATALEALIVRHFGLGMEDAICLVSDSRSVLGESKTVPWSDDLYDECKKAITLTSADMTTNTDDNSTSCGSDNSKKVISKKANANGEQPADVSEYFAEANYKSHQGDEHSVGHSVGCHSVGWGSTTGFSMIFNDCDDGDFSVKTHDRDDVYSVGVIREFKLSCEENGGTEVERSVEENPSPLAKYGNGSYKFTPKYGSRHCRQNNSARLVAAIDEYMPISEEQANINGMLAVVTEGKSPLEMEQAPLNASTPDGTVDVGCCGFSWFRRLRKTPTARN